MARGAAAVEAAHGVAAWALTAPVGTGTLVHICKGEAKEAQGPRTSEDVVQQGRLHRGTPCRPAPCCQQGTRGAYSDATSGQLGRGGLPRESSHTGSEDPESSLQLCQAVSCSRRLSREAKLPHLRGHTVTSQLPGTHREPQAQSPPMASAHAHRASGQAWGRLRAPDTRPGLPTAEPRSFLPLQAQRWAEPLRGCRDSGLGRGSTTASPPPLSASQVLRGPRLLSGKIGCP